MGRSVLRNPRILVLYKRSSFLATKRLPASGCPTADRFRENHVRHYESLRLVERILRQMSLSYKKRCRSRRVDYGPFDLLITVGGDGTFLEAARKAGKNQFILGVNSDPCWSVGRFCSCDASGFEKAIRRIIDGKSGVRRLSRLSLTTAGVSGVIECLNDLLICHPNPAAMSRYHLQIGKTAEEQRSSGIWFSTASGSTGAILSAGGMKMPLESRALQYRPRELYAITSKQYRLTGGIAAARSKIVITSRMTHGTIFVDGAHIRFPFPYGAKAVISVAANYVNMLDV